jgi:8-oxo-dGTP pyrophosphatase MutT (NUDIX family)
MRKTLVRGQCRGTATFQVAAVCFRRKGGTVEFLLVKTSGGRWTFPKGHREPGLSHAEVAALEALEEGGVKGSVDSRPIGYYLHQKESLKRLGARHLNVLAFLLEVKKADRCCESYRRPRWLSADDARQRLAQDRSPKYRRSIERVFNSAIHKINQKRSIQ